MKVLISGAGFSKAWGLPLTRELAQVIKETLASAEEDHQTTTNHHMQAFMAELQRVRGEKPDLEDVLTILREGMDEEYEDGWQEKALATWRVVGVDPTRLWKPPHIDVPDTAYHYHALVWAIGTALHWNGWGAPPDGIKRSWFGIPRAYAKLMQEFGPFGAVISLNYDILPEYMFYGPVDYGYPDHQICDVLDFIDNDQVGANGQIIHRVQSEPRTKFPGGPLVLKLHGSANMAYCPTCEKVLLFPRRLLGGREPTEQLAWLATAAYHTTIHCGDVMPIAPALSPGRLRPFIIPPVKNKEKLPEWKLLAPIQAKAVEVAKQATSVVIVGASLRESDGALTDVMRALNCRVDLIGGEDAEVRLTELGIQYGLIRRFLDETEADRTEVVQNKKPVDARQVGPGDDLGPGATWKGMERDAWWRLPSIQPDQTYLVIRMSCWPDSKEKNSYAYPTLDALVDGQVRRFKAPMELREWVLDRIGLAGIGARDIPGRVRFTRTLGKWDGHVYGP